MLRGPRNIRQLSFSAVAGQAPAFIPLHITDIDGLKPDGSPVANAFGKPGWVAVIGVEPLPEAVRPPTALCA